MDYLGRQLRSYIIEMGFQGFLWKLGPKGKGQVDSSLPAGAISFDWTFLLKWLDYDK